ncbi:MAG: hypothetical protein JW881_13630 [Spirochaetales bacterium]|nr:hypothetical protein [Spirochaetales bacterium]
MKKTILTIFALLFLSTPLFLAAQESVVSENAVTEDYCHVYFYPHLLNSEDRLQDGPVSYGTPIRIEGSTFLIWVDLEPEMRFVHRTLYLLLSKEGGVRIVKGEWWPVLNGKQILYGEESAYAVLSPINTAGAGQDNIGIFIYPQELYPYDRLVDGPSGTRFKIVDNTLLIWVDMLPRAFFTHPTAYILISKEYTRVEKGGWWPELNGRRILFGDLNKTGIISPFVLRAQHIDNK